MMLVVDTNVLLRFILKDDAEQFRQAKAAFVKAQHAGQLLWVTQTVVQELVWVLEYHYGRPRQDVVRMVDGLFSLPLFHIESPARVAAAIRVYEEHKVDFTDALLAAISHEKGLEGVLSFDRDMGRIGARWVRP
jgi:predicted nucleic-acid-binding protein